MENAIIIKVESGIVAEVYANGPVKVIVVDYDMIEGDETFERRMQKAVLSMNPEHCINPEAIDAFIISLVNECTRPSRRRPVWDAAKDACPSVS